MMRHYEQPVVIFIEIFVPPLLPLLLSTVIVAFLFRDDGTAL